MNQGGEQGHDDYGLPPVDIEIPDDARELYRDVQAYHRELRALRRHQRSLRWRAPFRRSGVAIPLLAGCLIVALVAVMISAMLTTSSDLSPDHPSGQPDAGKTYSSVATTPAQSPATAPATTAPATTAPATTGPTAASRLPAKVISVGGRSQRLSTLRSTVLAIVPGGCGCDAAVKQLLMQAEVAGVVVYLVAPRGTSVATLDRLAGLVSGMKATQVASDHGNVLTSAYRPVGLTVLLVDSQGKVKVADRLNHGLSLEKQLKLLKPAS
ncbi:MAG TPA: hypothetical protein VMA95_16875 [Streptosporangiaceae bacterium]|nr:hypothetical protein [Streptosporangiaceae bacterium]